MRIPGMPGSLRRDCRDIGRGQRTVQAEHAFRGSTRPCMRMMVASAWAGGGPSVITAWFACGPVAPARLSDRFCRTHVNSQRHYITVTANLLSYLRSRGRRGNGLTDDARVRFTLAHIQGLLCDIREHVSFLALSWSRYHFEPPPCARRFHGSAVGSDGADIHLRARARQSLCRCHGIRRVQQRRWSDHPSAGLLGWRQNLARAFCAAWQAGSMELAQHMFGFGGLGT